jgi:hypothetical protein
MVHVSSQQPGASLLPFTPSDRSPLHRLRLHRTNLSAPLEFPSHDGDASQVSLNCFYVSGFCIDLVSAGTVP